MWRCRMVGSMLTPWQLRFSLYSGVVITEGRCSLAYSFIVILVLTLSYALCLDYSFLQRGLSTVWLFLRPSVPHLWLSDWSLSIHLSSNCSLTLWAFPLYLGSPLVELWDSLSSLVKSGIACLASWSSDWLDVLWASLSSV